MNNSSDQFVYFHPHDAPHTSKFFFMAFNIVAFFISSPLMHGIIRFESQCHNRLLHNRLITSSFKTLLFCNYTAQVLTFARYVSGPHPVALCRLDYMIKNVAALVLILLLNFAIIIKYLIVFHSANPTAIQDDFWLIFLEVWAFCFGLVCQSVTHILPGKNPMLFYLCLGKMPRSLINENFKGNPSVNIVALMTIIVLIFTSMRLCIKKFKDAEKDTDQRNLSIQAYLKQRATNESVFVWGANVFAAFIFVVSTITPTVINKVNPYEMDIYPNYIWVYIHQLCINSCYSIALPATLYLRKPLLRRHFMREWGHALELIFSKLK